MWDVGWAMWDVDVDEGRLGEGRHGEGGKKN